MTGMLKCHLRSMPQGERSYSHCCDLHPRWLTLTRRRCSMLTEPWLRPWQRAQRFWRHMTPLRVALWCQVHIKELCFNRGLLVQDEKKLASVTQTFRKVRSFSWCYFLDLLFRFHFNYSWRFLLTSSVADRVLCNTKRAVDEILKRNVIVLGFLALFFNQLHSLATPLSVRKYTFIFFIIIIWDQAGTSWTKCILNQHEIPCARYGSSKYEYHKKTFSSNLPAVVLWRCTAKVLLAKAKEGLLTEESCFMVSLCNFGIIKLDSVTQNTWNSCFCQLQSCIRAAKQCSMLC